MSATIDLFDRFKAAKGITSDAAAGRAIGLKPSSVSNYRQGVRHAEPEIVRKLALALGEDPDIWVLRVQADRETIPERRKVWLRCIERLSPIIAIGLAVYAATRPQHGPAIAALVAFVHKPTAIDILHLSAAVTAAAATVAYLAAWSNRDGTSPLR